LLNTFKYVFKNIFFILIVFLLTSNFLNAQDSYKKQIYINKIDQVDTFSILQVNGNYIRNNIDIEFTNFGQHYDFNFIPSNEFWIDFENSPGEGRFFIKHMLKTNSLMKDGMDYDSALVIGDSIQRIERMRTDLYKKCTAFLSASDTAKLLKMIHREILYRNNHLKIYIADGEIIRDIYFIDFTEGGHDKVYNFIPKNEVWIDNDLRRFEIPFVLLHELYERYLMSMGDEYDTAHEKASALELKYRKNNKGIQRELNKYIKLNK
jgi:hypothetical protein